MQRSKIILLCLSLLGVLSLGASSGTLVRLTVVNRAAMPIAVQLNGQEEEEFYYLKVPSGTNNSPVTKIFTVVRDKYTAIVYYLEYWDPVYGFKCSGGSATIDLNRSGKLTVKECTQDKPVRSSDEKTGRRRFRRFAAIEEGQFQETSLLPYR